MRPRSAARCVHRGIDVARIAGGQRADRLAGRRIFDRQRCLRVAPAAGYEVLLGDHAAVSLCIARIEPKSVIPAQAGT
jgi:hypothetical protein